MVQGGSGLLLLLSERLLAHFSPAKLLPLSLHGTNAISVYTYMMFEHLPVLQSAHLYCCWTTCKLVTV